MRHQHAERIGTFEVESPEWRAARSQGLGGSEIAAVLGLSPWCSKFTLWHRKAGMVDQEPDNASMSWGRRLEAPIADAFADTHPEWKLRNIGTWRSKARPWQIANPDRAIHVPCRAGGFTRTALLECKTAHAMAAWEWENGVPVYYRTQALWYLDVFGFKTCHFAVLIGGSDYREFTVQFDLTEVRLMRDAAEEFLSSIRDGRRPAIDESDSTYATVRELHPEIDGTEKVISDEVAAQYLAACTAEKSVKDWKRRASAALLDEMGKARYALFEGERIAMRTAVKDNPPFLRPIIRKDAA
jgi:putative phage-type endonuclease